jgi:hypothetical protein
VQRRQLEDVHSQEDRQARQHRRDRDGCLERQRIHSARL